MNSLKDISQRITVARMQAHIDALATIGNLGPRLEDGFLRASWSDEESAAMEYIVDVASRAGFIPHYDEVGNLRLRFTPDRHKNDQDLKIVQVGSHLDTVVRGGLFDGGAGILAGLEACIALSLEESLRYALEIVVWRGEEAGTYQAVYKGSKAAFGSLPVEALDFEFRGQRLEDAIKSQGYSSAAIREQRATISQSDIDAIQAHIELHIEQATALEIAGDDIGIVTSIRGPKRFWVVVRGVAAHSGATPMGTTYRSDANLAMAYMQVRLDELYKETASQGIDLVQTVGVINSDQSMNQSVPEVANAGITIVCPCSYFSLDIRSNSDEALLAYADRAVSMIEATAKEFAVSVEVLPFSYTKPLESMDERLQDVFEESARELGFGVQRLASGAGHDITIVASQNKSEGTPIPCLLIFIPCRNGISHNPLEFTTTEAIVRGAQTIAHAVAKMSLETAAS